MERVHRLVRNIGSRIDIPVVCTKMIILGSYGNFEIMPLLCPGGFDTCTTSLDARQRFRKNNTDVRVLIITILESYLIPSLQNASPGYFSLTLDNNIQMEATSTRRAGLERFTFPRGSKPFFVLDLANDLPGTFAGGTMDIDPKQGRITMGGLWGSRSVLLFWRTSVT